MQLLKMTSSFVAARVRGMSFLYVLVGSMLMGQGFAAEVAPQSLQLQTRRLLPGFDWISWTVRGNPDIWGLRIDPRRYRFKVMNFRNEGASQPLSLWEWMDRSGALAVFNAGQYYPDFSYMGLLVSGGRKLHGRLHRLFQALFLAEPLQDGAPAARILDLAEEEFDPEKPGYLEIAQSFMLLDRWKNIRVRRSPNMAIRTILAEEKRGTSTASSDSGPLHSLGSCSGASRRALRDPKGHEHGWRRGGPIGRAHQGFQLSDPSGGCRAGSSLFKSTAHRNRCFFKILADLLADSR